jgi:glyoxylase-like metal-dependent hydrolase (beta-lactamase superfamily II)
MKRLSVFINIVCLTPLLMAQQREVEPVEFTKISEGLYETSGGRGARGGVYIGDDGVLVIDAKMDEATVDQIVDGIKKLTDKPIKFLVDTHSDGDHIWGNQFFPPGTTIVAHENCRKEFFHKKRDGSPSDWNDPSLASFLPSVTYKDKMDLYLGSKKVELWHFGIGHTKGDTVVFFPEEKVAFLADQIFVTRPQLIHAYKGGNSFGHVKNLTRMLDTIDAESFYNGHGERVDRDGIKKHIAQMKERQNKVKALVDAGKPLEAVKAEFSEEEGRLVEVIFNEIRDKRTD